jgi:hypothetical protein
VAADKRLRGKICEGCGAQMWMAQRAATSAILPAQTVRSVYILVEQLIGEPQLQKIEVPAGQLYISHFDTCPQANDFSRRGGP